MIVYTLSHPIQYFSPLLKSLAKEIDLEVLYFSEGNLSGGYDKGFGKSIKWDVPLMEGYSSIFIKNYSRSKVRDNRFWDIFNPGVFNAIRKSQAKVVVVNGWSYSTNIMAIVAAKFFRKQLWLRAENPLNQELLKSKTVLNLKKVLLKHFLFKYFVDKALFIGKQNKNFFSYYGIDASKMVFTPYAVDNDFFRREYAKYAPQREQLKETLKLRQKKIILFSGKYISKKRPLDLIKAYSRLNRQDIALILVGEGELRSDMQNYIEANSLENVILTGFVNQSEISKYYAISDVFVMCSGSGETWGLSVNEAMNFELPVVVSRTCGCSEDLVSEGVNGLLFDEGDIEGLANCLKTFLGDEHFLKKAGMASKVKIEKYSITGIVNNILHSLSELPK